MFALMLFAVLGVRSFHPEDEPRDEILAYEVTSTRGVEVTLHGGVSQVTLTSWLMAPIGTPAGEPLPYALDVQMIDAAGNVRSTRRFGNYSSVSLEGPDSSAYQARIVDAMAAVTEPRTIDIDMAPLGGGAGRLRVRAAPGKYEQVLLRLAHRVPRSRFEKALLVRTMSSAERTSLTGERSSLGFFDMPEAVRTDAIAYWQQRLMAAGREGRDYTVRRLLIGDKAGVDRPLWQERGFESSNVQRLAINLTGPVTLRVFSTENTRVVVSPVGRDATSSHAVPAGRSIELTVGEGGAPGEARTVVLHAEPRSQLSLSAPLEAAPYFLTSEPLRQTGGRLEVRPTLSYQAAFRLHAERPLVLGVAPDQTQLGLSVRSKGSADMSLPSAECEGATEPPPVAVPERNVRAVWRDEQGAELSRTELRVRLRASCFEHIDELPASEREVGNLHVPARASELHLFGDEDLFVTPFVPEPGVDGLVLNAPYATPPPLGLRWRYAPLELKDWALIRPDNEAELRQQGRAASLQAQVRLSPVVESTDPALAPRGLDPLGEALSRPVFSPTTYSPKYGFPDHAWVLLNTARPEREIVVPRSGAVQLLYLADASRLGQSWAISADGVEAYAGPLAFQSGSRQLQLAPGKLRLGVAGLGEGGLLFVQAPPAGNGVIVRRQTFHALDAGQSLDFEFRRRAGELLAVSITIATPGANTNIELEHVIDAGQKQGGADHFYRRTSQLQGQHALRTGSEGEALIWSEPFPANASILPDRLGRLFIPLGDDLALGAHRLRLHHPAAERPRGGKRYWVRAVLVGRVLGHP